MREYTTRIAIFFIAVLIMFAGCDKQPDLKTGEIPEVKALYATQPVKIDGVLDDKVWQVSEVYPTSLSKDNLVCGPGAKPEVLQEVGKVRVAWDENWLYLAFDFTDSDVLAEGKEDGLHHYKMGDLAEVFLKLDGKPGYWELYATPLGKKTTFFFPSKGRQYLPSNFNYKFKKGQLKVAAKVNGTVNDYSDRDKNWTAEMAIPVSEITSRGETFGPKAPWRIFVGRYNYSFYLPKAELSMMPSLSKTSYHLTDEYAKLKLLPKDSDSKPKK